MVAEFGIAPNSSPVQGDANLSQLFSRKVVPPRGNAPRSIDYRSIALLLSYGGEKSPVKVTLPRVSDVSRARYYYANGRKVLAQGKVGNVLKTQNNRLRYLLRRTVLGASIPLCHFAYPSNK